VSRIDEGRWERSLRTREESESSAWDNDPCLAVYYRTIGRFRTCSSCYAPAWRHVFGNLVGGDIIKFTYDRGASFHGGLWLGNFVLWIRSPAARWYLRSSIPTGTSPRPQTRAYPADKPAAARLRCC